MKIYAYILVGLFLSTSMYSENVFSKTREEIRREYHEQELAKEKPILDSFHWQTKMALGAGTLLMDNGQGYVNIKLFLSRYGEDNAGMRFLGVGAIVHSKSKLSFSPVAINMNHWLLSVDIQANEASSVGLSLNYSF